MKSGIGLDSTLDTTLSSFRRFGRVKKVLFYDVRLSDINQQPYGKVVKTMSQAAN